MASMLLHPNWTLIVGVEDDPGGVAVRVYVGARFERRYYLISDPDAKKRIVDAWAGSRQHVVSTHDELAGVGILLSEAQ